MDEVKKLISQRDRNHAQFLCACNWLGLLEQGTDLVPYFEEHGCGNIAIYGAAALGKMLLRELQNSNKVNVKYYIDQAAEVQREKDGIPVYLPEELADAPDVDMIVVTAIAAFKAINRTLLAIRPELPVVSLEKIINARISEEWSENE